MSKNMYHYQIALVALSFGVFFDLHPNNGWVNNREAGDLRRHYDVTMTSLWRHCNGWGTLHTIHDINITRYRVNASNFVGCNDWFRII